MRKTFFLISFLLVGLSLSAQLKPRPNLPQAPAGPRNGSIQITKPMKPDFALSKCDRYKRYYKRVIKLLLTSNPTEANPLKITESIPRAKVFWGPVNPGHLVIDKTAGSVPFKPISVYNDQAPSQFYPVAVTGFRYLENINNQSLTIGFNWESGNYADVISVEDVYKVGQQMFADLKRANGAISTIRFYALHRMDGCEL